VKSKVDREEKEEKSDDGNKETISLYRDKNSLTLVDL
jgi:hypothetical protein